MCTGKPLGFLLGKFYLRAPEKAEGMGLSGTNDIVKGKMSELSWYRYLGCSRIYHIASFEYIQYIWSEVEYTYNCSIYHIASGRTTQYIKEPEWYR